MSREDVHPLFKDTPTNHLIQLVDAPIRECFYYILRCEADMFFLKDVSAGKKVGFVFNKGKWTLLAYEKNKKDLTSRILKKSDNLKTLNTITKKYPSRKNGVFNNEDKDKLQNLVKKVFSEKLFTGDPIEESDISPSTLKILVCNAQHPNFSKTSETNSEYSKRFQQLINVIKKVRGPDIYTFSEVHPVMEQLIRKSFHQSSYHIVAQTYDPTLKVSLVTVLKKQALNRVDRLTATMQTSNRIQTLLLTLASTNEKFVLHAAHLPHQGNNIDRAEKIIINDIFSHKEFSLYPQILTGDLNITLQEQGYNHQNIATSVAPEATINKGPGEPTYRWNRTLGTLTLPRLREDAKSPSIKLDFYSKMQLIDVESHHSINPKDGSIYSPPKETPSALIGEFRLFSRFGKKYHHCILFEFKLRNDEIFDDSQNLFERFLPQAKSDVAVYQRGDQYNANFEFVLNISNRIWNKLKLFLDSDLLQCRYSIRVDLDKKILNKTKSGKQAVLLQTDDAWMLYTCNREGCGILKQINKQADKETLDGLAKKYPSNNNEIKDDTDKAALEKIVTSHGGITRQIEAIEHPDNTSVICRSSQKAGQAIVKAMAALMDKQFKNALALEEAAVKKNCSWQWTKEKDVFYIQFSFTHRGQLIAQYLKQQFSATGEIIGGDQFKLPLHEISEDMAERLSFLTETAAFTEGFNNDCCSLITLRFEPKFAVGTGSFHIKISHDFIANNIFTTLDHMLSCRIALPHEAHDQSSLSISYEHFFQKLKNDGREFTWPDILANIVEGILKCLPYGIKPSQTAKDTIVSKNALPYRMTQNFKLTQGKVTKSYFSYTLASGISYADIAVSLHDDFCQMLADIFNELKNYTGENTACKELHRIINEDMNGEIAHLKILYAHCQQKINLSSTSKSSYLWSTPKSDKHTDLLHNSLTLANALANFKFNCPVDNGIKTLQQLINTQERRELVALCIEERKRDGEAPYNKFQKNSALLLLENHLILSHPEYTANDVWENIKHKPVEYHGTRKNYLRESDGEDLTLGDILKLVKKIWNALSLLVTSNDVTTHASETLNK